MVLSKKSLISLGLTFSLGLGGIFPYSTASAADLKSNESINRVLERLQLQESGKLVQSNSLKKGENEKVFSENLLIIKYKAPLSSKEHQKAGAQLVKRFSSLNYDVVQIPKNKKLEQVIKTYTKNPNVLSITRSAYFQKLSISDVKSADMYHLKTLQIDNALKLTGKHPVKVAVVDTGIDVHHPELKEKIVSNYNLNNPMQKGAADLHGTHVAGIIAAEKGNGIGGHGVFPSAQIIAIDVFGRSYGASDYIVAEGILEAIRQKAKVINLSLGSTFPSPIVEAAIRKAIDANITVVAAAGNMGTNIRSYPAAYEGVIGVGATNEKNQLADFSSYGPAVDVVAPGENIYSSAYEVDKKSTFMNISGTSMATPIVAATAAMLLSKYPTLTPYQVNYIINKTATDLGAKGYDTTYGNGLVNPVAALQYNPKNIPVSSRINEKDLLKKAEKITFTSSIVKSGYMTKPNQTDWYQFDVEKGEYIQTRLLGAANFDYKYDILFYPTGKTEPATRITVNDVMENELEGYLFEVPQNGKIVIGVKDALGNYNENRKSNYTLSINRTTDQLDDGNNEASPLIIPSLPYDSSLEQNLLFFTNELTSNRNRDELTAHENQPSTTEENSSDTEEQVKPLPGDSDYFRFIVPNSENETEQTIEVSLTGVAGIDSTINLYIVEKFEEGEETFENKILIDSSNWKGYGYGEELAFNVLPGMEYIIEVTNKPFFDPFFPSDEYEIDLTRSYSSHFPYKLKVDLATLPPDEDGFPMGIVPGMPEEELTKGNIESYIKKRESLQEIIIDPYLFFGSDDFLDVIRNAAQPHNLGEKTSGHFQYSGDEDWFTFTPKNYGIYEFSFASSGDNDIPVMEVFKYDKQYKSLSYIGSNLSFDYYDIIAKNKFAIGLKGNETYYIKLNEKNYRPSFKSYMFTSTLLVSNVTDKFEDNDEYEKATQIGFKAITGNFASAQDNDIYYFTPKENGIYGFAVQPLTVPNKYNKLPKELLAPIDLVVAVIEDTNRNKKLDKEEEGNYIFIDRGWSNEEERGAFKAVKTKGYFVVAANFYGDQTSLMPYKLQLTKAERADEDSKSVIKNNVPSRPIPLKKANQATVYNSGYMNMTNNKGDVDHYSFTADEERTYIIKLELPSDLDGIITVYNEKGKEIGKVDHYRYGDSEYFIRKLKKGKYFIKVEDAFGNASIEPYKLIVRKQ